MSAFLVSLYDEEHGSVQLVALAQKDAVATAVRFICENRASVRGEVQVESVIKSGGLDELTLLDTYDQHPVASITRLPTVVPSRSNKYDKNDPAALEQAILQSISTHN